MIIELEKPLMENNDLYNAIKTRRTKRNISDKKLDMKVISDILFCACGQTKKATTRTKNKRTIASSCNSQKVHVYCATKNGVFLYLEKDHALQQVHKDDVRSNICKQPFFKEPPFVLLYVATKSNTSGIIKVENEMEALLVGTEVGAMSQNVSLYCAYNKLHTTLIALNHHDYVTKLLPLKDNEVFLYSQVIGFPKK